MVSVYQTLHESLQSVLLQRLGWSELREVQEQTCRAVCAGKDVLVLAPTAGGKTEAALIPVTDALLKAGSPGIACLYISPLKALINDQESRFLAFSTPCGLEVQKWHGDVPRGDRVWLTGEPPHYLMITPESLEVLLLERDLTADLKNLKFIVVDEVHAFVESERGVHLRCLIDRLDGISGMHIQRIGLSATVGNPEEVLAWLSDAGCQQEVVKVPVPAREKKFSFVIEPDETRRMKALRRVISQKKAIVFVNSRSDAEKVMKSLSGKTENLSIHHSSISPEMRKDAEQAFSREGSACIVCTSSLELGIDIGDLDIVVQLGAPGSVSSFLQRMGRSGRRGKPPYVAFILPDPCSLLCTVSVIESASRKEVEPLVPLEKPYNVMMQQLLLELVRSRRISARRLSGSIRNLTPFRKISPQVIDTIIRHLKSEEYLVSDGEMLMPGARLEREFGQSHWRDLYSVIPGAGEYRAVTPDGEVVGRLDARFVNSAGSANFQLGGKNWTMVKCDDSHNRVVVVPGSEQKGGIFWTGGENGFSPVVCRGVARIIGRGRSVLPLPPEEVTCLGRVIGSIPSGYHPGDILVRSYENAHGTGVILYVFRSRMFGKLFAPLLAGILGKKARIRYNDFSLSVKGLKGENPALAVTGAAEQVCRYSIGAVMESLPMPGPEGWKYGALIPPSQFREMVLADTYHIDEFMKEIGRARVVNGDEPCNDIREPGTGEK
ncbi:MAG TPA: DEAD/DEAH box helicase [Methanoregulaceae archaeon]|nr:DEAD/DEAH box helicase [Methanoregulaceae archaeon]